MKKILTLISVLILLTAISFGQTDNTTLNLSSGQSLSDSLRFAGGHLPIAILMPSGWDAANLTFQGWDPNAKAWKNIYTNDGTELTYTAAASRWIILKPIDFAGVQVLKIRSGTSGTPVTQTSTRQFTVLYRKY